MIYGILTIPQQDTANFAYHEWKNLIDLCDLPDENIPPVPHLTWHVANEYDFIRTEFCLAELVKDVKPIYTKVIGLGIFSGLEPVIYLPVFKNSKLIRFHQKIWKGINRYAIEPSKFYAPDTWIPHLTLAFGSINNEKLQCTLNQLVYRPIQFDFLIDQIIFGFLKDDNSWGIIRQYSFST
jgi:2'-5' RNA ligase